MKKILFFAVFSFLAWLVNAQSKMQTDERAIELLNNFMQTLMIEDFEESAQQMLKYTHKSLWNADGTNLSRDLRDFSFKKAKSNAKFYQVPVKITRVRETNVSAIGYAETAEKGKVVDYFIAKKAGVNGMPAPVKIFFPADGSAPKISYMGSL
jgi:hypothetical protein